MQFPKFLFFTFFSLFFCCSLLGQKTHPISGFSSPGVNGQTPAKGFIFETEALSPVPISTGSGSSGEIMDIHRQTLKLRLPMVLRPGLKVIAGFQYRSEEFTIRVDDTEALPYLGGFQDRNLKSIGGDLAILVPSWGKRFQLLQVKGQLSGDFNQDDHSLSQFFKGSVNVLVGWKENPNLSWGIGASYRYTFGRHAVYPVLHYNQTFNDRWGIEATLPVKIEVRYNLNPKTVLYAGTRLTSSSYPLFLPDPEGKTQNLKIFRWTDVRVGLRLEREIHDWLWIGAGAGYRTSLGIDVSEPFSTGGAAVLQTQPGGGWYANVGLYFVVPKKWR